MSEEKMSVEELLLAIALDPVLFVEAILQAKPEEWQKKALYAVRDNDRVAIRSGHGIGKTAFLSWLILWWVLTRSPSRIACTANTASQLSDILFGELKLKPVKKTKTGYSTDITVLKALTSEHELPILLLKYRSLEKLKSTYVDTLPKPEAQKRVQQAHFAAQLQSFPLKFSLEKE